MDFSSMKDMFNQVRDAQKQMKEMQKELSAMRVSTETGGGTVKAVVDGEGKLIDLDLDLSLIENGEKSALSKLIIKAVQEAQSRAKKEAMEKAKGLTGGLNIPGLGL